MPMVDPSSLLSLLSLAALRVERPSVQTYEQLSSGFGKMGYSS